MKFKWRIAAAVSVAMTATVATAPFAETVKAAEVTDFGMAASGFVTQAIGGQLPVNSGRTASSVVSCTRTVPREESGNLVGVDVGAVRVEGATTNNRTQKENGKPASISRTEVADVFVGPDPNFSLHLETLVVETRTWHASDGFHRKTFLDIGPISLVVGGLPVPVPRANFLAGTHQIVIPGVAEVQVGLATGRTTATSARSQRTILDIELLGGVGDPVHVMVGRASSNISDGFTGGVFNGRANAVSGVVAGGLLTVGPVAPKKMPCKGTGGVWRQNTVADFNLTPIISGSAATARVSGLQGNNSAIGKAQSELAQATLAGELVIEGVKSNIYVRKNQNGTFVKNVTFDLLSITVAGTPVEIPDPGDPIDIPTVGTLTYGFKRTRPNGVLAIAVRLVLLDDTVVDLGQSSVYIN